MTLVGAFTLVAAAAGVLSVGCCSSGAKPSEPGTAPEEAPAMAPGVPAGATFIVSAPPAEADLSSFTVAERSFGGGVVALKGQGEAPAGVTVLSRLDDAAMAEKAGGLTQILNAVERALEKPGDAASAGPAVSCYIKLDAASAPAGDDARRAALAEVGFEAQTIAGDVVTGRARVDRLGALLGTGWVIQLELPGSVLPR
jgi:hypothetical protein